MSIFIDLGVVSLKRELLVVCQEFVEPCEFDEALLQPIISGKPELPSKLELDPG